MFNNRSLNNKIKKVKILNKNTKIKKSKSGEKLDLIWKKKRNHCQGVCIKQYQHERLIDFVGFKKKNTTRRSQMLSTFIYFLTIK